MKAVTERRNRPDAHKLVDSEVRALASGASLEAAPARILEPPGLAGLVPRGTAIYVPFLPRSNFGDTLAAASRLVAEGLRPVPHLPARALGSRGELRGRLSALQDAGVDSLLLIAGDCSRPCGPFGSTLEILESGLLCEFGFRRLGVAGHPEGHPGVNRELLDDALVTKRDYARETGTDLWIVTQFVFSGTTTLEWLCRVRELAGPLSIRLGIPGPARLKTLIAYAAHCGVSASARLLRRQPGAARLLGHWTPDGLLRDLATRRGSGQQSLFDGIHVFPFGGISHSADWLRRLAGEPHMVRSKSDQNPNSILSDRR